MKVTLFGAAGDVTGSAYYVQIASASVLVDFGSFQGRKEMQIHNETLPPLDLKKLDAVILTHAHLDHTGRLPLLVKSGYKGPVYATKATIDVAGLILMDSAKIQGYEIKRKNRKLERTGEPLLKQIYGEEEVKKVMSLFIPVPYNTPCEIAEGCFVRLHESGHLLGSASIEMVIEENGNKKIIVFSGDIGPDDTAIVKNPEPFSSADLVFLESTYGDHNHKPLEETLLEGKEIIDRASVKKGKIFVPAFAIGRSQQLLYYLARGFHRKTLNKIPVYLDSPMAIKATKVYAGHKELYDDEAAELYRTGVIKSDLSGIHISESAEDSIALNNAEGPCMIIAGGGMCNAGRILHHLKHNLYKPETTVMITGYQGTGSLGRKLLEGSKKVKIFGEEVVVRADIAHMGGLSAHADQSGLLKWFDAVSDSKPVLVLSHGEDKGRKPLAEIIKKKYNIKAVLPEYGETIML